MPVQEELSRGVLLSSYGPVMDPAMEVARRLTRYGEAEVYVPYVRDERRYEKALGMAVDVQTLLSTLYPFIDTEFHAPQTKTIYHPGREDPRAKRYVLYILLEKGEFCDPGMNVFRGYNYRTMIDLNEEAKKTGPDGKTKVVITAQSTPIEYQSKGNVFIDTLRQKGVNIDRGKNKITIYFDTQNISGLTVNTSFQDFNAVGSFTKPRAGISGNYYPVSESESQPTDHDTWRFFQYPPFWKSWGEFMTLAVDQMSGRRSYEQSSHNYRRDVIDIRRHAERSEAVVVDLLRLMLMGENSDEIDRELERRTERLKCPHEYKDLFLEPAVRMLNWLCHPKSLRATDERRQYLENLARAATERGLSTSPEELATIYPKHRAIKTQPK